MIADPSTEVLLLMPPLTHLLCHTDIGIPQQTAYLRARGHRVTQMDLNSKLLYKRLYSAGELCTLAGELSLSARRQLLGMYPYQQSRIEQMMAALDAYGLPEAARKDSYWDLLQYLAGNQRWRPRVVEAYAPGQLDDATILSSMTELSRALDTSLFLRKALVSIIDDQLFNPFGYASRDVAMAVSRPPPRLLVELLDQHLAPSLTRDLRIVGMTIHSTEQLVPALQICKWIRARTPEVHTVLGGPWAMAARELLMEDPVILDYADSVCLFEGEATLAALTDHGTSQLAAVPGLVFKHDGEVVITEAPRPIPLEAIPAPVFDGMIDDIVETTYPFRTVRGCFWGQCVFCHHVLEESQSAFGSELGQIVNEAQLDLMGELLADIGSGKDKINITLADNATPPETLVRIARKIKQVGCEVGWEALVRFCNKGFAPEICHELAEAGCERLFFGLETADPDELRRLHKGIRRDQAVACLANCAAAGIKTFVFLLDYPSAPRGSWRETLEFVLAHEEIITAFIPARFLLARGASAFARPDRLGIKIPNTARKSFSVFDLPFSSDQWQATEEYEALTEEYTLKLIATRACRLSPVLG